MGKASGVIHKTKRFRIPKATEGDTPMFSLRLPLEVRHAVDQWAAAQEDSPGRSEAIRRLLEIAFKTEAQRTAKPKPRSRKS
jgi:hypothetical protein